MIGRKEVVRGSREEKYLVENLIKLMPKKRVDDFMRLLHESTHPPQDYKTAEHNINRFLKKHSHDFIIPVPSPRVWTVKQLFRIRKDVASIVDPTDFKEWGAPPNSSLGRFNLAGEKVLYVGNCEEVCRCELALEDDEPYYLAEYRVLCQSSSKHDTSMHAGKLGINSLFLYPPEFFCGENFSILIQQLAEYIASDTANRFYTNYLYKHLCENNVYGIKLHGLVYSSRYFPIINVSDFRGKGVVMHRLHNIVLNHDGIARLGLVSVKLKQKNNILCEHQFDNVSVGRKTDG